MDVGQYNTINLQKELAEGLREVLEEDEEPGDAITRSIIAPMIEEDSEEWDAGSEEPAIPAAEEYIEQPGEEQTETEVFFGTTGEIGSVGTSDLSQPCQEILTEEEVFAQEERAETDDRQTGRQTSKILEHQTDLSVGLHGQYACHFLGRLYSHILHSKLFHDNGRRLILKRRGGLPKRRSTRKC